MKNLNSPIDKNHSCIVCGMQDFRIIFKKESPRGELFNLARCRQCGLEFIAPLLIEEEIKKYYTKEYFTQRTDRGYDNYFSDTIKDEIRRIIELNLNDLGFNKFEQGIAKSKRALDIGCAAGYFVDYMQARGWNSYGVDISEECVNYAQKNSLNVFKGNYLEIDFPEKFHLITLWATIEHLRYPDKILEKISNDLEDNGMLYISTCRIGGINFMKLFRENWRYYNFPEHMFFFSFKTLNKLLVKNNLKIKKYITYGSGYGKQGTFIRKTADFLAKKFYAGDMMLISAGKITH